MKNIWRWKSKQELFHKPHWERSTNTPEFKHSIMNKFFASKFEHLDETDEILVKYKLTRSSRSSPKSEYHISLKGNK